MYYLSLGCGFIALIFSVVGVQCKNKKIILLMLMPANFFYSLSYLFLGALVGFWGVAIATVRTFVFFCYDYKNKRIPYFLFAAFCLLLITTTVSNFKGVVDLLSLSGLVCFTYGTWQKNENVLRIFVFFASVFLMSYNLLVGAYIGATQEAILMLASIFALIKFNRIKN